MKELDISLAVEKISKLSYLERRIAISKHINNGPSRFIYKYRSIDPDSNISIDRIRDIIVRSRLWLSSPSSFNDPFDMSANFIVPNNPIQKRKKLSSVARLMEKVKRKERGKYVKMMMQMPHSDLEARFKTIFENNVNKVGVFSFAGDPRSILMWSHYANNHNGICIQFEVARDFIPLSHAVPVSYSLNYPQVNWLNDFANSLSEVLVRKHEGWSYEEEKRIVLPGEANKYLQIDANSITGIIFGCKANSKVKDIIHTLNQERIDSGYSPIKLYQATQHKNKYKLIISSHT